MGQYITMKKNVGIMAQDDEEVSRPGIPDRYTECPLYPAAIPPSGCKGTVMYGQLCAECNRYVTNIALDALEKRQ
jgi:hypothetical protein